MEKNWWDEGIPEEGENNSPEGSGGSSGGYAWWQRELPNRFYLKVGEKKELTFIDEKCIRIWEHQYWIDGMPGFVTCTKKIRGHCPLCDAENNAYGVGFFTIIDHTGYTDREGTEHKDFPALLPAKYFTLDLLRSKYEMHDGLKGNRFLVCRTSNKKAPTVGDDWNFLREETLPSEAEPFDYNEVLAPMSEEDMRNIVKVGEWRGKKIAITTGSGYMEDANYDEEDGSVPF